MAVSLAGPTAGTLGAPRAESWAGERVALKGSSSAALKATWTAARTGQRKADCLADWWAVHLGHDSVGLSVAARVALMDARLVGPTADRTAAKKAAHWAATTDANWVLRMAGQSAHNLVGTLADLMVARRAARKAA